MMMMRITYFLSLLLWLQAAVAQENNNQNLRANNAADSNNNRKLSGSVIVSFTPEPTPEPTTPAPGPTLKPSPFPTVKLPTTQESPCVCFCKEGDPGYNIVSGNIQGARDGGSLYKIWNYGVGDHKSDCVEHKYTFGYDEIEVTEEGVPRRAGYCDVSCLVPSTAPSQSPKPSSSAPPSNVPTVSNSPSVSSPPSLQPSERPSDEPTQSPRPTWSQHPSVSPTLSSAPSMNPTVCVAATTSNDNKCLKGRSDCVTIACADKGLDCCQGSNACVWPESSKMEVCPHSCNGRNACSFTHEGFGATIYSHSCNGLNACKNLGLGGNFTSSAGKGKAFVGRVQAHSCDGVLACEGSSQSSVGTYACNGIGACNNNLSRRRRRRRNLKKVSWPDGVTDDTIGDHVERINPLPTEEELKEYYKEEEEEEEEEEEKDDGIVG